MLLCDGVVSTSSLVCFISLQYNGLLSYRAFTMKFRHFCREFLLAFAVYIEMQLSLQGELRHYLSAQLAMPNTQSCLSRSFHFVYIY